MRVTEEKTVVKDEVVVEIQTPTIARREQEKNKQHRSRAKQASLAKHLGVRIKGGSWETTHPLVSPNRRLQVPKSTLIKDCGKPQLLQQPPHSLALRVFTFESDSYRLL